MTQVFNSKQEPRIDYALTAFPVSASDLLYDVDLTLDRAIGHIPEERKADYWNMWRWFAEGGQTGELGSRRLGKLLPGVGIPHAAQRGIHVPARQRW